MGQLVSQDIPNLVGGVSQQSPTLRLPTQATEQINCWNSVVEGLMPRRGTEHIGLCGIVEQDSHIMDYRRDEHEHYRVVIRDDGVQQLRVFDARSGSEYPVKIKDDLLEDLDIRESGYKEVPYLTPVGDTSYREAFQLLPVKDTILLLNRTVPVERMFTNEVKPAEPSVTELRRYELRMTAIDWRKHVSKSKYLSKNRNLWNKEFCGYGYIINGKEFVHHPNTTAVNMASTLARWINKEFQDLNAGVKGTTITITVPKNQTIKIEDKSRLTIPFVTSYSVKTLSVKTKNIEIVTDLHGRPKYEALVWVKRADYATNYQILLNGETYSHKTPEATSDQARDGLRTEAITASLVAALGGATGITAVPRGNVIHLSSSTEDFTIETVDSLGNTAMVAVKRDVRDESDLPGAGVPEGYKIKVRGELTDGVGSGYWLEYKKKDGGQGVWEESYPLGSFNTYDLSTMPLSLSRKQEQQYVTDENPSGIFFELHMTEWEPRVVGDEDSAPFPSFVSKYNLKTGELLEHRKITAMCIFQNRLMLASGDTLCISEVDRFFNLFPTTVATTVDSDAMETSLDSNDVLEVKHITPGAGTMVLWTDRKQYVIQKDQVFTADRVSTRMVSAEAVDLSIEPLAIGNRVFFVSKRGKYQAVKELYLDNSGESFSVLDISSHIPEYIEGIALKLVGNTAINSVFLLTTSPDIGPYSDTVYVYNYFDEGNERVQSAWSKWKFGGRVIDISVDNTMLSFLIKRKDVDGTFKTFLETVELSYDELEQHHEHRVYLDAYQHRETPWEPSELREGEITKKVDDRYYKGYIVDVLYEFSPFFLRDDDLKTRSDGRLQLRRLFLNYHKTSNFILEVETLGRETRELLFQGRVLGRLDNLIGKVPVTSGRFSAPIMGQSGAIKVRIRNKEIFGFTFQSAYWEGFYHTRNRKV